MNKRFIHIMLALVAAAFALPLFGQSSDAVLRDKITNAVMKVYDEQIAIDPNDYNTLFARAHQHFYNGDYTSALADVNQAMMLTPKTDKELRFDEYILRARISDARKDYTGELADLQLAQALQPKSLACTDLIAKANLKAGNLDAAEKAFKTILRAESMNYDAMYGLAQVEQARGNAAAAVEQVSKAVSLFRVEPQVYVNRADIYARQNNIDAAVLDLLQGMTVGDGGMAAQRLFELSDTHYDGVMHSLLDIADKSADGGGVYRYLRANIAMDHNRYGQALNDLNKIRRSHLYEGAAVDYHTAKCCFELCRYDEALQLVDRALRQDPLQPEYYLLKSSAEYYAGDGNNTAAAMEALNSCSLIAPQYVPMLVSKAELYVHQGDDKEALGYLNAALANEPDNAEALYLRALTLKRLDNYNMASKDLNTMMLLDDEVYNLKGLAYNELGRDTEALQWLHRILSTDMPGGENLYYAALFMAKRGDNYMATEYLTQAIAKGYGSLHNLTRENLTPLTLAPMRDESGFDVLIEKARPNFEEQP